MTTDATAVRLAKTTVPMISNPCKDIEAEYPTTLNLTNVIDWLRANGEEGVDWEFIPPIELTDKLMVKIHNKPLATMALLKWC